MLHSVCHGFHWRFDFPLRIDGGMHVFRKDPERSTVPCDLCHIYKERTSVWGMLNILLSYRYRLQPEIGGDTIRFRHHRHYGTCPDGYHHRHIQCGYCQRRNRGGYRELLRHIRWYRSTRRIYKDRRGGNYPIYSDSHHQWWWHR